MKKGWKRIGIVLSVIWFVAFGGYLWSNGISSMDAFHRRQIESCYSILSAENESLQYIPIQRTAISDSPQIGQNIKSVKQRRSISSRANLMSRKQLYPFSSVSTSLPFWWAGYSFGSSSSSCDGLAEGSLRHEQVPNGLRLRAFLF
jgi:hypothetical protein